MSIPIIDKLQPLGRFPAVDAKDVDVNGARLDAVLTESATVLASKASKEYVDEQIEKIPQADVTKDYVDTNFAKKSEIPTVPTKVSSFTNDAGYLTEHQSLAAYAKKTEIPIVPSAVSAFANDAGYLTQHQDISGKADESTVIALSNRVNDVETDQSVLDSRVSAIETGDWPEEAEILGIRTGVDGTEYQNAGDAVRGQINDVKEDISELTKVTNDILENGVLKKNNIVHTSNWTKEIVIDKLQMSAGITYAFVTRSASALPSCYLHLYNDAGQEIANRNIAGKTLDKWTYTPASNIDKGSIRIASESAVSVEMTFGKNIDGNAIQRIDNEISEINTTDTKIMENLAVVNEVLENPIMYKKTMTHTGWTKEIIFDEIDIVAGLSYAVKAESNVSLPSCYLHLYDSKGVEISNRSLSGKQFDKWVISADTSRTGCTLRIASESYVNVDVSWGINKDNDVIDDLKDAAESTATNSYAIENVRNLVGASLYLRKIKHCKYANKPYTVFDNITIKPATSYTLEIKLPEAKDAPVYVKMISGNGEAFKTITLVNDDFVSDRFSSSVIRDGVSITAQYSGYDTIDVDVTFKETFETNLIDNLIYKGEYNIATSLRPKDDRRAMLTIIDDDGKSEFYDIYKSILESGTKITCAIDPVNWVDTEGFMTWEQISELKSLGCEFVVHGAYPWLFPKSDMDEGYPSANALRSYISAAQKALKEHNIEGWNIGVYPQSNHNHDTRLVMKDYFTAVFAGTPPQGESCVNVPPITTFRIYRMAGLGHENPSDPEPTLQEFKNIIDETLQKRGWLVILNHSQYGWDTAKKQKLLDAIAYAKTKGVSIVDCQKGLDIYRNVLELGDFNNKSDNQGLSAHVIGSDGTEYKYPPVINGKKFVFNSDGSVSWTNE